jgi:hypothetical protein
VLPRVLTFSAGIAAGAAVVALSWWLVGGGSGSGNLLQDDPGIAPPEYAYLDNARVLAYLAQIEGGLSTSEKVTEQLSQTRNAGVNASGLQAGGSSSAQQFVERVVTPTATTRFYHLLDRLRAKGYLETVDFAHGVTAKAVEGVKEGDFVRVEGCRMRLPVYDQMVELIRGAHGSMPATFAAAQALNGSFAARAALQFAQGLKKGSSLIPVQLAPKLPPRARRLRLVRIANRFAAALGSDPRVAVSTCDGRRDFAPRRLDLLFPIRLGALNADPGVLAGPVTIVGKLLRLVRKPSETYVDDATLASASGPVGALERAIGPRYLLSNELDADVTVLAPGAVILPIAIYK